MSDTCRTEGPDCEELPLAYSVDRSWTNNAHNAEGEIYRKTKLHRPRDTDEGLAACTPWLLLNTDCEPGLDPNDYLDLLCRRCFPRSAYPEVPNEH